MSEEVEAKLTPEEQLALQVSSQRKFNAENNVASELEVVQDEKLQILIHNVMRVLYRHYPGYEWLVSANDKSGVLDIYLPDIGGSHAYTLHLNKLDVGLKKVVRAAGEILERYNLSRKNGRVEELAELHRDFQGVAIQK